MSSKSIKLIFFTGIMLMLSFILVAYYLYAQRHPNEYYLDLNLKSKALKSARYQAPALTSLKKNIVYLGKRRLYYVYIPTQIKSTMPVLLALHGSSRTGASLMDSWRDTAESEGFIVIAPNGLNNRWLLGDNNAAFFSSVIEEVLQANNIMASEIFMFGHSNGAKKAIALAAHNPDLFDGVVAHAGTLPIEAKQGLQVNSHSGFKLGLLLGGRDHLFSIASARQTLRWLASMGMDSHLFVLNGHSHWYYDDAPQINALAWWYLNSDTDVLEARE